MHRLLGVPPNAEYDEVQQAVKALKEKYAGDTKRLLKIDVAKDKIAELRLRQRVWAPSASRPRSPRATRRSATSSRRP